jgi:hypothetical protein
MQSASGNGMTNGKAVRCQPEGRWITCAAFSVAEVTLRVQLPPHHQRADVAAAHLHRLPALQQHHRDAGLRDGESRKQARRASADDHYRLSGLMLG